MPPDALPPDDEREPDPRDATVVDPDVLAERRAQRAEHAERSATRRAADAQSLAADLARERARLEAERDAARAEAAAAREGADAVKEEARHLQVERDALRIEVERALAEREAMRAELEHARSVRTALPLDDDPAGDHAAPPANGTITPANGKGGTPAAGWADGLRRELIVSRTAASQPALAAVPPSPADQTTMPALARERDLVARRAEEPTGASPVVRAAVPAERAPDASPVVRAAVPAERALGARATPATALALERERSTRLQAELERSAAIQGDLRTQLAALEHAVHERREAEQRIETALRRVRSEFDAARQLDPAATQSQPDADRAPSAAEPEATRDPAIASPTLPPFPPALATVPPAVASVAAAARDAERIDAARARLRTSALAGADDRTSASSALPLGSLAPWLPIALRRLAREEPRAAGRILVALLPAQGHVTSRELHYDVVLTDRRAVAHVDVVDDGTTARLSEQARPRRAVDFRITADEEGLARLLLARRRWRRGVHVRGSRRRLRELRRLVSEPLALRDLAIAGAMRDPFLAFSLIALAVEPAATYGHRFTIAHAPMAGGPADTWLRIQNGAPPAVLSERPGEAPVLTIRSTRDALLPLIADVPAPPGDAARLDGDPEALTILRGWIDRTEHPDAA